MRQQTYMLVSPYMQKGSSYSSFKNQWKFSWEQQHYHKIEMPTAEEIEQIKTNHAKILKEAKTKWQTQN
jgi:hypothetical protein